MASKANHSNKNINPLAKPLSRRHFFGLTAVTGSLAFVGAVSSKGNVVTAFADEAGEIFYETVKLKRSEAIVAAIDPSTGEQVAVSGVKIKLTKYDRNLSEMPYKTVTTGSNGMAVVDLRSLSDNAEDNSDYYTGSVNVYAEKDGYQTYENKFVNFSTGVNDSTLQSSAWILVPAIQTTEGVPYMSYMQIFGSDLISYNQEMTVDSENTAVYNLEYRMMNLPPNKKVICQFLADKKPLEITAAKQTTRVDNTTVAVISDSNGEALFAYDGAWFSGDGSLPKPGSAITVKCKVEGLGSFVIQPSMKLTSNLMNDVLPEEEQIMRMGSTNGMGPVSDDDNEDNKVSESSPMLEKYNRQKWEFALPMCPVKIRWTASGGLLILITIFSKTLWTKKYEGDEEKEVDKSDLQLKFFHNQLSDTETKVNKMISNAHFDELIKESAGKKFYRRPMTQKYDLSLAFELELNGKFRYDKEKLALVNSATAKLYFYIQYTLELCEQMMVGPVPVFFGLDLFAKFTVGYKTGVTFQMPKNTETKKYAGLAYGPPEEGSRVSTLSFPLLFEFGISFGFGVRYLASVSVRGYMKYEWANDIDFRKTGVNEDFFVTSLEGQLGVEVKVELFMFSMTVWGRPVIPTTRIFRIRVDKFNNREIKGGWEDDENPINSMKQDLFGGSTANVQNEDTAEFKMITDAQLKGVAEQTGKLLTNGLATNYTIDSKKIPANSIVPNAGIIDPYDTANSSLNYNPVCGTKPNSITKLASDVFFSTHFKTFEHNGYLYMFRIASVNVELNEDFQVFSNYDTDFVVPKDSATLPSVKFDNDGNVVFDNDGNIQYDIPKGLNPNCVAKYTEDCFGLTKSVANDVNKRKQQINEFFKNQKNDAENLSTAFAARNGQLKNGSGATVARSRVICTKFNISTSTWSNPKVLQFSDSNVPLDYKRINCFDCDLDATTVGAPDNGRVRIAVNSTSRANISSEPTVEDASKKSHTYLLEYDLNTEEVIDCKYIGGDNSFSAPRLGDYDAYSYCRQQGTRSIQPEQLGIHMFSDSRLAGNTINLISNLNVGDSRFTNKFALGSFENFFVNEGTNKKIFSAWILSEENEVGQGGLAVFWTSFVGSDGNVAHDFVLKVDGVENITYLGEGDYSSSDGFTKCIRYYILNKKDSDDRRRCSIVTFPYDPEDGKFMTGVEPVRDPFGNVQVTNVYRGEDANHIYATRIMTEPVFTNSKTGLSTFGKLKDQNIVSAVKSPFVSDRLLHMDEDLPSSRYQLLESRWNNDSNSYHEMFPIATLDFVPDNVDFLGSTTKDGVVSKNFVCTNITNGDLVKGDIYMVRVPIQMVLHKGDKVSTKTSTFETGVESDMTIELSNAGTMPITSLTVDIYNPDAKEVIKDYGKITNLAPYMDQCDVENYKADLDESGVPKGTFSLQSDKCDEKGVLWPGRTRAFTFTYVLPDGFNPEHHVEIRIKELTCDKSYAFNDEIKYSDSIVKIVDPKELSLDLLANTDEGSSDEISSNTCDIKLNAPDYILYDEDDNIIAQTNPKAVNSDSTLEHTSKVTSATSSSETGDNSLDLGLGLGAAAIGAFAAGVAAYEKRRSDNESNE